MTGEILAFLGGHPVRVSLFEAFEAAVSSCGESTCSVSKAQISWGNPRKFAFFSLPLRRGPSWPEGCAIATFGLGRRLDHPRIFQAVEPYPGRWTHHVVLTRPEDMDGLLRDWLAEAYLFAKTKRRAR